MKFLPPPHSRLRCFIALFLVLLLVLSLAPTAFADPEGNCSGGANCTHIAKIGDMHYGTLQEAVNAVPDSSPTTIITLLRDVDDGDGVKFQSNKNITIDFSGLSYICLLYTSPSPRD